LHFIFNIDFFESCVGGPNQNYMSFILSIFQKLRLSKNFILRCSGSGVVPLNSNLCSSTIKRDFCGIFHLSNFEKIFTVHLLITISFRLFSVINSTDWLNLADVKIFLFNAKKQLYTSFYARNLLQVVNTDASAI
jgi:hypothetical protein